MVLEYIYLHEVVTQKDVYIKYGNQMKAYDETFLKNNFSTWIDPREYYLNKC